MPKRHLKSEKDEEANAIGQVLNKNGKTIALILKSKNHKGTYLSIVSQRDKLNLPIYGIKGN